MFHEHPINRELLARLDADAEAKELAAEAERAERLSELLERYGMTSCADSTRSHGRALAGKTGGRE